MKIPTRSPERAILAPPTTQAAATHPWVMSRKIPKATRAVNPARTRPTRFFEPDDASDPLQFALQSAEPRRSLTASRSATSSSAEASIWAWASSSILRSGTIDHDTPSSVRKGNE